jgi:hypothetical protein
MGLISDETKKMINLVERGPLGSGEMIGTYLPDSELE